MPDPVQVKHETTLHDKRVDYVARDSILGLLSEAELARVSSAEEVYALQLGDEYIDLEHLGRGVGRDPTLVPRGRVLPRSAVCEETWARVLAVLGVLGAEQ